MTGPIERQFGKDPKTGLQLPGVGKARMQLRVPTALKVVARRKMPVDRFKELDDRERARNRLKARKKEFNRASAPPRILRTKQSRVTLHPDRQQEIRGIALGTMKIVGGGNRKKVR